MCFIDHEILPNTTLIHREYSGHLVFVSTHCTATLRYSAKNFYEHLRLVALQSNATNVTQTYDTNTGTAYSDSEHSPEACLISFEQRGR